MQMFAYSRMNGRVMRSLTVDGGYGVQDNGVVVMVPMRNMRAALANLANEGRAIDDNIFFFAAGSEAAALSAGLLPPSPECKRVSAREQVHARERGRERENARERERDGGRERGREGRRERGRGGGWEGGKEGGRQGGRGRGREGVMEGGREGGMVGVSE